MAHHHNNFDTLRFVAAFAVLWSHSFSLAYGNMMSEPIVVLSGGQTTLGTISVAVFFVISGYLITQSFERSSSRWRFIKARVLRIMPGLLCAVLLGAFVLGPALTAFSLQEYFTSRQLYRYVVLNGGLLGYTGELPGVFADNPQRAVNGPIWTLRFEAGCYALVFALGVLGLLNRYAALLLFSGGLIYVAFDGPYTLANFHEWNHHIDLATKFLAGVVMYYWIPRPRSLEAGACAGISLIALVAGGFWLVLPTAFAYVVLYAALMPLRLPNLAHFGDLSYGTYIYAWPVKQLAVLYNPGATWYEVGALATAGVLLLAFLSWHLVEKRALSFKDHMTATEKQFSERLAAGVASARGRILVWVASLGERFRPSRSGSGGEASRDVIKWP